MKRRTALEYAGILLCLLPILILRDFTPANELKYLSIADEALRQHHFLTFTCHGVLYADKPPLYLWIVMLIRLLPVAVQHIAFGIASILPAVVATETLRQMTGLEDRRATLLSDKQDVGPMVIGYRE